MAINYPLYINKVVQQKFTASGTYTPTSGMVYCIAEAVGGGGAGGGGTSGSGNSGAGGGGGGGGYARAVLTAAQIGASQTVTIGAGGTVGSAGNNPGNNGADTSLGSLLIAKGGTGGSGSGAGSVGGGGAGGIAGTGDFTFPGGGGNSGGSQPVITVYSGTGKGGDSFFGSGAVQRTFNANITGVAGSNYGGGGGGGLSWNGSGDVTGGAGAAGVLFITEYIAV